MIREHPIGGEVVREHLVIRHPLTGITGAAARTAVEADTDTPTRRAMISYGVYRLVHLFGIMLLFLALGGLALHAVNGGTKATNRGRAMVAATHGLALFVILLGGFGMLARLGIAHGGLPGWIWGKLGIWVVLGAMFALPYRFPALARPLWLLVPLLGLTAAYLAFYKPL